MAKKNKNGNGSSGSYTYLILGLVITAVVALFIYYKCKIHCDSSEQFSNYLAGPMHLYKHRNNPDPDPRPIMKDENICNKYGKCPSSHLDCTPGERCGPLSNCAITDKCCSAGNLHLGFCYGSKYPCYDDLHLMCGGV